MTNITRAQRCELPAFFKLPVITPVADKVQTAVSESDGEQTGRQAVVVENKSPENKEVTTVSVKTFSIY
jgi:hypothetical protein